MSKHYYVGFTVEVTVKVEADNEAQAISRARHEIGDTAGDGNYLEVSRRIERVNPDGPANEEAYGRAVDHVNAMEKAHGYDSDQARDARALLHEAVDKLDDDA